MDRLGASRLRLVVDAEPESVTEYGEETLGGCALRRGFAFPQGSLAPSARAGSDPEGGKRAGKSRPLPGRPSGGWRGVAPSPILRANAEDGGEDDLPEG